MRERVRKTSESVRDMRDIWRNKRKRVRGTRENKFTRKIEKLKIERVRVERKGKRLEREKRARERQTGETEKRDNKSKKETDIYEKKNTER